MKFVPYGPTELSYKRCNSIANTLELWKRDVAPLLMHWSYEKET